MRPTFFCFFLCAAAVAFAADTIGAKRAGVLALPGTSTTNYQTGKYDGISLQLLRSMSATIPLRTTALKDIAPKFAIDKHDGITWDEAVAEANARFGQRQPDRAVFLRKYLAKESPEVQLKELQWAESGMSSIGGSGSSTSLIFGDAHKPEARITVWIARQKFIGDATLSLSSTKLNGVEYSDLSFDVNDRLISANRKLPADENGMLLSFGENTTGTGGVNFYSAQISGTNGESESIDYTPELVIKARYLRIRNQQNFREVYEDGKLRKRVHYGQRQTNGGTQSFIAREESFP